MAGNRGSGWRFFVRHSKPSSDALANERLVMVKNFAAVLVFVLVTQLSAARAQDGGVDVPRVISVRSGLLLSDDGNRFEVDGGAWLRDDLLIQRAQDFTRLDEENRQLKLAPRPTPVLVIVTTAISIVLGAAGGAYATWTLCKETTACDHR